VLPTDLTVGAVVERDGAFLIVEERVSGTLVLTQPGGHIESDEAPEETAVRETLEEAGCRIRTSGLLGVYLWIHPQTRQQFLRIMYSAELIEEGASASLDHGVVGVHWYGAGELRDRRNRLRTPVVLRAVDDYLYGRRVDDRLLSGIGPVQRNVTAILEYASLV